MADKTPYHHGDLRSALLQAGAEVLHETGIEKFSLRKVARKVGVSHSAPAHHFTDSDGLLMAIAADGFRNLLAMMEAHHTARTGDLRDAIFGSGLGYVAFAQSAPATFRLMFGGSVGGTPTVELQEAGFAAFQHLAQNIERLTGRQRETDPTVMTDILAAWSMVHGYSHLLIAGQVPDLQQGEAEDQDECFRSMFDRSLPATP